MSRKAMLVAVLAISTGLFGQRSGAPGGTSGTGSAGSGSTGSNAGAGSGIGTSATQAGTPTTQGAVGGISGQAAAGPITPTPGNVAGNPTLPSAMAGPAGTTGSTQANPDNLNNGVNFNGGVAGGGVAGSGVLSTPGGTFASPAPTAGITDAGRAGISANTPANTGVQSTLENSTVVYTNGAPVNPRAANISTAANSSGRLINDMGPSYFSNTVGGGSTVSLGEVAAQMKAARGTANARMLTNDDVQKMVANSTGVTVAKNMPPLGPGAAMPNGTSQDAASQSTSPSGSQTASQGTMAQGGAAQAGTQAQSGTEAAQGAAPGQQPQTGGAAQGQSGGENTAGNSTTPQINPNQQSNDAQGRSRLPATSTFLPLLGALGLLSGGIGLWFRKFRK